MKIKHLFVAGFIAFSGMLAFNTIITTNRATAAFNPDAASGGCPATSLYKQGKGKPAAEVKTLADCNLAKEDKDLMTTATDIINVIVGVIGVIAVAVIVIGGILYVTSAGDAAKAKKAMHAIMYAIVGLVIAILAFAIVNFVLKSVF